MGISLEVYGQAHQMSKTIPPLEPVAALVLLEFPHYPSCYNTVDFLESGPAILTRPKTIQIWDRPSHIDIKRGGTEKDGG